MAKARPNLAAALAQKHEPEDVAPVHEAAAAPAQAKVKNPARKNQINIAGWFPLPVKFTLDELKLKRQRELGRTVSIQELMGEAYNEIFKKYGLPEVAPVRED